MGLLSKTVSMARYKVDGKFEGQILETVADGLKKNMISEIDGNPVEKTVGWTSFENPFKPGFKGSSFSIGTYLVFSMRIDRKVIPAKVIKKHIAIEAAKLLAVSGRSFFSKDEKAAIKDRVINTLILRIPATPNVYDILWNYEDAEIWFFSSLKAANEEFETLFAKSFNLTPIRLFPYTMAALTAGITDTERDVLANISSTKFTK
ncbi:MAG: recombination-associated protein RdgC [Thermodesulfobacteriota bacterium]|nr:recombination-associated protein RdgC [Thermodesulfobacteriota bacterium]